MRWCGELGQFSADVFHIVPPKHLGVGVQDQLSTVIAPLPLGDQLYVHLCPPQAADEVTAAAARREFRIGYPSRSQAVSKAFRALRIVKIGVFGAGGVEGVSNFHLPSPNTLSIYFHKFFFGITTSRFGLIRFYALWLRASAPPPKNPCYNSPRRPACEGRVLNVE